jgi:hypothetical protein
MTLSRSSDVQDRGTGLNHRKRCGTGIADLWSTVRPCITAIKEGFGVNRKIIRNKIKTEDLAGTSRTPPDYRTK